MPPTRNPGRVAGVLYLLLALVGSVRIAYIPSKHFVHGNASAIAAHESLFRLGIVADLFVGTIVIFVTLTYLPRPLPSALSRLSAVYQRPHLPGTLPQRLPQFFVAAGMVFQNLLLYGKKGGGKFA